MHLTQRRQQYYDEHTEKNIKKKKKKKTSTSHKDMQAERDDMHLFEKENKRTPKKPLYIHMNAREK